MRKPNWRAEDGDSCQWPRCKYEGTVHYLRGSTDWITPGDGVWLCDAHQAEMGRQLFPERSPGEVGQTLWLKADDDYPREQVYLRDWWIDREGIICLVSETPDGATEEVNITNIES